MPNHCQFCDIVRPKGGTNHLVLNNGEWWIEYCPKCGDEQVLEDEDGKFYTLNQIAALNNPEAPVLDHANDNEEGE